jgi:hypothetical protein
VHFGRVEPFVQAGKYVRGLMSDLPRKNSWTLAEYAGDATPDRMQRRLERASWDRELIVASAHAADRSLHLVRYPAGITVVVGLVRGVSRR